MFGKIKEKWNGLSTTKKGVITIVGFMAVGALTKFAVYKACENRSGSTADLEMATDAAEETATVEIGSSEPTVVVIVSEGAE